MSKRFLAGTAILLAVCSVQALAQVQSPEEFLGYELGSAWTPHYKVVQYFEHLDEHSPLVALEHYGYTYEGRELVYAVVTSQANHANLDEIRVNNLRLTGLEGGAPASGQKAIVWLSYNVHGNETSSSEAALKTAYALLTEYSSLLDDVVVIMDPMVNPDGRDRYVNWYRSVAGKYVNPLHEAREHYEPWPGGRTNHYYFDLNRDWAWQTQQESRQRVKAYQEWMPHIHVDFHEQGYSSPYYFAPAASPFHTAITTWQNELQTIIGRNNARHFDSENWLYFTREVFDLFYPSYGDTWPTFNGAIGMTYEQAGHGFSGLGVLKPEGDTLTLHDRLMHHYTTGISTIEVAAQHRERMVNEFTAYFDKARKDPAGEYKSFIIKRSSNPDNVSRLLQYLVDQKIMFGEARKGGNANGYDYATGERKRISYAEGDIVININQPKGTLARVLFEPKPELVDSLTYDITAWEAYYAFGVEGYALTSYVDSRGLTMDAEAEITSRIEKPYAYLAKWNSLDDLHFLAQLLKKDIKVRYAEAAFTLNGKTYKPGTLIITRNGNEQLGNKFDEIVKETALQTNRVLEPVATGLVETGKDFGSSSVRYIQKPKVAILSGEYTRSNNLGYIWHFFDQQVDYPATLVNTDQLLSLPLHEYQVLILPAGSYSQVLTEAVLERLTNWVRSGGRLIVTDNANDFLTGKPGFGLKRKTDDKKDEEKSEEELLRKYGEANRARIPDSNPGAIFKLHVDNSHPLAFGYGEEYFSLKLGTSAFAYLENGWNVGVAKPGAHRSGFTGYKAQQKLEHSLAFGVQGMGRGQVIYMIDNPLFRGFWHNGKLLFGNAVFLVGN